MDTITHGITGALIAKAFFTKERSPAAGERATTRENATTAPSAPMAWQAGRVAVLASTLGAIFPDADVFVGPLARNDLAIIEWHRGVTHSLVCLPIWAVLLAALTHWFARRRGWASPSWPTLVGIYAAALASHILLDLITSFGTMIWSPLRHTRPAWDLVFIIDFALLATVLAPQLVAWVYRTHEHSLAKAVGLWSACTLIVVLLYWSARTLRFPFPSGALVVVSAVLAALFFLPAGGDRGFHLRRATWCRAGVAALGLYLCFCAAAHRAALHRVEQFAAERNVLVEEIGAMPLPPSLAYWDGLIRTSDGIYEGRFSLFSNEPPILQFLEDSPQNRYFAAARGLPRVQAYLWFARFPLFRYNETLVHPEPGAKDSPAAAGGLHIVEIRDLRFFARGRRPAAFTFRVTFDDSGRVLEQGLVREMP